MDMSKSLGLPDVIYQLLLAKSLDGDSKLEYNISGVGECMEVTLRWSRRGTRWEQPFSDAWKYKSPANRTRDRNRKKMNNVKKNSKSVSTEDGEILGNMCMSDMSNQTSKTPVSTSKGKKRKSKRNKNSVSSTTNGHSSMVLRSRHSEIEQGRNTCMDYCHENMFSPASVEVSPGCMAMTMADHLGHQLTPMDIENINSDSSSQCISNVSDHDSDESLDGSDCATDYENNSLGMCGLSSCEYGPSVDMYGVIIPRQMLKCEVKDCGWVVCRECFKNGGTKGTKVI